MRPIVLLTAAMLWASGCAPQKGAEDAAPAKSTTVVEVAPATVMTMSQRIAVRGTLVAADGASAQLAPVSTGRLLDVRVRVGDEVSAGQVVAEIDNRVDREQARSAAAAVAAAAADRQSALQAAQASVQTNAIALQKLRNGPRPQEVAQARLAVRSAQATLDRAQIELARVEYLHTHGTMARRQLDDARTALAVARTALETAQQQASLVEAGPRVEDVRSQQAQLSAAERAVTSASAAGDAHIAQARAALEAADATVRNGQVVAPFSGRVVKRMLNPGDVAGPGSPVLQIAQTRRLILVAAVPPAQIGSLRAGQIAMVHPVSGGATLPGHVVSIGQADPQSGLIEVRIAVDNAGGRLRIGEFITADVVVATEPRAVTVPTASLVMRDGRPAVYVLEKGDDAASVAREKAVETGMEQGGRTQIKKGVSAGQSIIVSGASTLEDGGAVKLAEDKPEAAESAGASSPPPAAEKSADASPPPAAEKSADASPQSAAEKSPAASPSGARGK